MRHHDERTLGKRVTRRLINVHAEIDREAAVAEVGSVKDIDGGVYIEKYALAKALSVTTGPLGMQLRVV